MLPPLFTPETSIPIAQASWWLSAVGETSAMVLNSNAAIHHVHLGKLGWASGFPCGKQDHSFFAGWYKVPSMSVLLQGKLVSFWAAGQPPDLCSRLRPWPRKTLWHLPQVTGTGLVDQNATRSCQHSISR